MLQPLSKGPLEHGKILQSIDCLDIADKRHAPEFRSFGFPGYRSSRGAGLQKSRISGVPVPKEGQTTKVPDFRSTGLQGGPDYKSSGFPEYRSPRRARLQKSRIPVVPEFRNAGFQ